ncbi:MAG TPA: sulfotransferase [Actinomycetota bacterium]|nr:sulfotransferase [Actinomycetota bacterium]
MTLPTFLGIGVPRAGTTWLHAFLASHPDVYLPARRKEVRFFDRYYGRGLAWYEGFFCPEEEAPRYAAIGEISPQYFYCDACPDRIADSLPGVRLLLMLRHPVDRAYSNYGFRVQRSGFRGSFEEFLARSPGMLERGHYARYLDRYLRRFDRARLLVLLFEEVVRDDAGARGALAAFLGLRPEGFAPSPGRVNPSTVPRFRSVARLTVRTGRRLRRMRLEPVVDLVGRLGLRGALTRGSPLPPIDPELRRSLAERFEEDFEELERRLGIDLAVWRG